MRQVLYAGGATFDGKEWFPNGMAVLVEDARIKRVAKTAEFDGFAGEKVDTTGGALMPGLVDCHVHLTLGGEGDPGTAQMKQNLAQCALSSMKRAQETLAGGTVAVRDCGGRDYVDLAVRDAANRGDFVGPIVRAAGKLVCMTGGHGNRTGRVADGVDEVVKAVREQIHAGADFIKIMATGGVMTPGVNPEDAHYTRAEMVAGLAEARRFNKRSASHAQGAEGIMNAVVAGVTSIEHGIFMDDDCIKAMLEHGTYLVPTLAAVNNIIANKDRGIPSWAVEKSLRAYERHLESFRRFLAAGGKIALGTDAGTPYNIHGENAQELRLMVDAGMTSLQALIAGTSAAADLVGLPDHGTIAEGKLADLLMVDGDPIADISRASDRRNHRFVLKNGKLAGQADAAAQVGGLAGSGPSARAAAF